MAEKAKEEMKMYKVYEVDFMERAWELIECESFEEARHYAKQYFKDDKGCVSAFVALNEEIVWYRNR